MYYVCMCARACMHVCVCAHTRTCVCTCVYAAGTLLPYNAVQEIITLKLSKLNVHNIHLNRPNKTLPSTVQLLFTSSASVWKPLFSLPHF